MFLDEAKVTAAFNHPHIAQVFDLDVADGELFLAMEFVPGATLVEVAKACRTVGEPIPMGFSLQAVRDTALALHYAHTFTDPLGRPSSVIHRDVAEKNIMVTYEGVTKLLDFGIAKSVARKSRTQVGMVKGTSGYMSPEQILGEPLDARSDLFSLGVVLHELLTGLRLFHAKTPQAGASAVLHGQIPPPSRVNKAVPPELDTIVLKALDRRREDRYASTLEFARAMERAVGPLFWHPEQSAELIQRHFSERREQTRKLLMAERAMSGESTGQVNVAQFLSAATQPEAPVLPLEPGTVPTGPTLPQITPQLPPSRLSQTGVPSMRSSSPEAPQSKPPTPRPSLAGIPAVKPPPTPPAPEETQSKPPTPPRGSNPRRSGTSTALPSSPAADPASVRRAVFEPLPQKRATTTTLPEAIPPAPLPNETTARTHPGDNLLDGQEPDLENATRPIRVDMHLMGTIPVSDSPPSLRSPPPEDEHTPASRDSHEVKTALVRSVSKTNHQRLADPPAAAPSSRPPRRREHTPVPIRAAPEEEPSITNAEEEDFTLPPVRGQREDFEEPELTTRPVRVAQFDEPEPQSDTNETYVPEGEEGPTMVSLPSASTARKRQKQGGGAWMVVLTLVMVLLGGLGVVIALGLDGGLMMGWISPPPPPTEELGKLQPIARPKTPATTPAPETTAKPPAPEPTPAPATVPAPAAAPAATPPQTPAAAPEAGSPATAAPPAAPSDAVAEAATPPPATEPVAKPEGETSAKEGDALSVPDLESTPSAKKTARPTKRTRRDSSDDDADDDGASGSGALTLVTQPYAKVYLGRRYLGDTPLFKVTLPSGKHSLKLVGADGRTRRLQVEIKTGETTARQLALDEVAQE